MTLKFCMLKNMIYGKILFSWAENWRIFPKYCSNTAVTFKTFRKKRYLKNSDWFANSIRNQLLSRMFSKTKIAELNKKLIYYPFDCNKKKILEETLNTLKKFPDIPSSGIDKLMDKLVGKKSDIHIFLLLTITMHSI